MPSRQQQQSQGSRQQLLVSAAELIAQKGYLQTTFADVADRAGISRGSIPWHFGTKDGLLRAIIEDASATFLPQLAIVHPNAEDAIDTLMRGLADGLRQPSVGALLAVLVDAIDPQSPIHDQYVAFQAELRSSFRAWFNSLSNYTADKVAQESFPVVMVGAVIGIHAQWQIAPDAVDLDQSFTDLGDLLRTVLHTGAARKDPSF